MQSAALKLPPDDNVLIALRDLRKGEEIDIAGASFFIPSNVPAKHKFCTSDLSPGDSILMYGVLVGKATQPIPRGSALSTLNIRHEATSFREKVREYEWRAPDISHWRGRTLPWYPQ